MSVPLQPTDERYGRFRNTGDGARIVIPHPAELADLHYPTELNAIRLTKQTCRNMIDHLLLAGHVTSTARDTTLWVLLFWAKDTGASLDIQRNYTFKAGYPLKSIGYTVSLPKPTK